MAATPRVVLYGRLSRDRYKGGEDEGVKVEQQLAECRAYAAEHGYKVVAEFGDNDLSATTGVFRDGFERVLTALSRREADAVVCWHTDRFVRRSVDLERVLNLKVPVYGLHAVNLDLATPAGRAVARTLTAWAEYEGEQKAERFSLATQRRQARGQAWWPGKVGPMGFNRDGTHTADAALVADAYRRLLDGESLGSIVRRWDEDGVRTPRGARWVSSSLGELLRHPRNAALLTYREKHPEPGTVYAASWGEIIGEGAWAPIVSRETWDAAQVVLSDPSRRHKGPRRLTYLQSGLSLCGTCLRRDGKERTVYSGSQKRGLRHYRCSGFQHNQRKADETDEYLVFQTLSMLTRPGAEILVEGEAVADRSELVEKRAKLEGRSREVEEMYTEGDIGRAEYLRLRATVAGRLEEVAAALSVRDRAVLFQPFISPSGLVYPGDLVEARAVWDALPLVRRQELARGVFERVVLEKSTQAHRFHPSSVSLTVVGQAEMVWLSVKDLPPESRSGIKITVL